MNSALRVVFMGTPEFAVTPLTAILNSAHKVIAVYTRAPQRKGRGQQVTRSPVHDLALAHDIPVFTPGSLRKSSEAQDEFMALKPDVAVVAAYGLILPQAVLAAPKFGCLNIHGSILPRWRGASPIQHAVWSGDSETGVTIMQMDEGLDTGAMIDISRVPITTQTTSTSLYHDLGVLGANAIVRVLDMIARDGKVISTPQPDVGATLAPMLKKEDGLIDWTRPAGIIDCQIRALNPWPGTYVAGNDGPVIKILSADVMNESHAVAPGTILHRDGRIACGNGTVLKITMVQAPSGKKMDLASLINGGLAVVGACLA